MNHTELPVISETDSLKFTSVKKDGAIIHFRYEDVNYTLINGGLESTLCIRLY